jgi:hypothetical protein
LRAFGLPGLVVVLVVFAVVSWAGLLGSGNSHNPHSARSGAADTGATPNDPVILAAGDIAYCNPGSTPDATRTARLVARFPNALVMTLGDNAYTNGQPSEYARCYGPTWGVFKARTRPVIGEHDEGAVPGGPPRGTGYVRYFAAQLARLGPTASDPTKLYYSYDVGAWHIIVLNDNCLAKLTPGCDKHAQEQWLQDDLAVHSNQCVLAAWHRPRWSSDSVHGDAPSIGAFWKILYQHGVDLVLNGSAHDYERFAPQDPNGVRDDFYGIREFVVGTGGNGTYPLGTREPNSQVFSASSYGVLKLTLHRAGYSWRFVPVADGRTHGGSFTDSGTASCHSAH